MQSGQTTDSRAHTPSLLKATGRELRKEILVDAPPGEVWERWATEAGAATFFAPQASIDLAVGGAYEMIFMPEAPEGTRGSEGCIILSFLPGRMLSFTWNAPPHLPEVRKERTWVVVLLDPEGPAKTRVTVVHQGWRGGAEWEEAYRYFDRAWTLVLARIRRAFDEGPVDWEDPFVPEDLKDG